MAISSQKVDVRPVSFLLDDGAAGVVITRNLFIRPEDLLISDSSRVTVTQTLGGAFADDAGMGLVQIQLSGTTGWRTDAQFKDGIQRFKDVHGAVFEEWHKRRAAAVANKKDPGLVRLIFSDKLDDRVYTCIPMKFDLKRNKQSPLLVRYQIQLTAIGPGILPAKPAKAGLDVLPPFLKTKIAAALDSLKAGVKAVKEGVAKANAFIQKNLLGPVNDFVKQTEAVMGAVQEAITQVKDGLNSVLSVPNQLLEVATQVAVAGKNLFQTFSAIADLPGAIKAEFMKVAAAYNNFFCLLKNAFKRRPTYETFENLYGASNCSSTAGGRPLSPLAEQNPFSKLFKPDPSPVSVTSGAQAALKSIGSADPVMGGVSLNSVGSDLKEIVKGVLVA